MASAKKRYKRRLHELELIAEHVDIMERVIIESTDEDPATRRKVLRAIAEHRRAIDEPPPVAVTLRRVLALDPAEVGAAFNADRSEVGDDLINAATAWLATFSEALARRAQQPNGGRSPA